MEKTETLEERDQALLELKANVEQAERRAAQFQEAAEKAALLLDYLEPKNEELSCLVAQLTVENTRLRILKIREEAA